MKRYSSNIPFFFGAAFIAIPLACLVLLVISTGQQIEGLGQTIFFGALYAGFWSGFLFVPLGIILIVIGCVQHFTDHKRKPPENLRDVTDERGPNE